MMQNVTPLPNHFTGSTDEHTAPSYSSRHNTALLAAYATRATGAPRPVALRGSSCKAPVALPLRALVGTNQSSLGEEDVVDFLETSLGYLAFMWLSLTKF